MLRGKMTEKGYNVDRLAAEMGKDRATIFRKLNAAEKFTIGEAMDIKSILGLTSEEASLIFLE
jgi:plasmid maintenance system antidote protein VapI